MTSHRHQSAGCQFGLGSAGGSSAPSGFMELLHWLGCWPRTSRWDGLSLTCRVSCPSKGRGGRTGFTGGEQLLRPRLRTGPSLHYIRRVHCTGVSHRIRRSSRGRGVKPASGWGDCTVALQKVWVQMGGGARPFSRSAAHIRLPPEVQPPSG